MVVSNNKVGEVWLPRTRLVKRVMLLPSLTALGSNLANCMFIHKIKEWRSVDWSYEWPGSRKPFKTNLYWGLHKKKDQLYWNKAEIWEFWLLKRVGAITLQIFTKMLQSLREQISHVTTYVKKKNMTHCSKWCAGWCLSNAGRSSTCSLQVHATIISKESTAFYSLLSLKSHITESCCHALNPLV